MAPREYVSHCLTTTRNLIGVSISLLVSLLIASFLTEHSMLASGTTIVIVTTVYITLRLITHNYESGGD